MKNLTLICGKEYPCWTVFKELMCDGLYSNWHQNGTSQVMTSKEKWSNACQSLPDMTEQDVLITFFSTFANPYDPSCRLTYVFRGETREGAGKNLLVGLPLVMMTSSFLWRHCYCRIFPKYWWGYSPTSPTARALPGTCITRPSGNPLN